MDLVTNGVVITDAIKFVQHKKEELNHMNSNKDISGNGKEEAEKRTEEKGEKEIVDFDTLGDNPALASENTNTSTKNQVL